MTRAALLRHTVFTSVVRCELRKVLYTSMRRCTSTICSGFGREATTARATCACQKQILSSEERASISAWYIATEFGHWPLSW